MDLLSGDDFYRPATENPLALVPVNGLLASSVSDQNLLALVDMFPQNNNTTTVVATTCMQQFTRNLMVQIGVPSSFIIHLHMCYIMPCTTASTPLPSFSTNYTIPSLSPWPTGYPALQVNATRIIQNSSHHLYQNRQLINPTTRVANPDHQHHASDHPDNSNQ